MYSLYICTIKKKVTILCKVNVIIKNNYKNQEFYEAD